MKTHFFETLAFWHRCLHKLYDWTCHLAASPKAVWALVVVSFVESSCFPIPPDVILLPMILANRQRAFRLALYCTISSVLGGFFGYFIGAALYETIGVKILDFYHYQAEFEKLCQNYNIYGSWLVFTAGLTPIPYKIFTIASGVTGLNLLSFGIASVLARGGRFFIVAWLAWKWGEPMKEFIEKKLGWLTLLAVILLLAGFYAIKYL